MRELGDPPPAGVSPLASDASARLAASPRVTFLPAHDVTGLLASPDGATITGVQHHVRDHAGGPRTPHRALVWALVITGAMGLLEAVGAFWSGSLALLSDAGHMATDAAALGLALFASRIAHRPPSRRASYGYVRAEVIAAFVNALALLALVVFITVEAVRRLLQPAPVAGSAVLAIAIAGLIANVASAWMLSRASPSMNTRGALLHVLSDALGSVAAIVAGAVIVATNWTPIGPAPAAAGSFTSSFPC